MNAQSVLAEEESDLVGLISGERTYGTAVTLEKITLDHGLSHYSFRSGGSSGANSAADWILNQFQEFELVAYREPFNFTTWDIPTQPRLVIDKDKNPATKTDQIEIPSFTASHYSWSTSETGIFGNLVALSPSNSHVDTSQKIVLVGTDVLSQSNWRGEFENKLLSQTPAAIIFTWWYEESLGIPFISSSEGRQYWNLRIPIGWVSYEDGLKIRKLAQQRVAANVTIVADMGFGPHYNIVGKLDGMDPSKTIVFSAHYDTVMCPGFADNGAGTAGLIELARAFSYAKKNNLYLPPHTILFIAFASEEMGLLGSIQYVHRHKAEMDRITAVINLDCIGADELTVAETWSDLDQTALNVAEELHVSAAQIFEEGSDHTSFANPSLAEGMLRNLWPEPIIHIADAKARPAVTLASHPLFWIHTAYDSFTTPDWIKADNLEDHVKVAAMTGLRVTGALPPVVKQSSITCTVVPLDATVGTNVTMSGSIIPMHQFVAVSLRYSTDGLFWYTLTIVNTNSNGDYSYSWVPEVLGLYYIQATWAGDTDHLREDSNVCNVTIRRAESRITCQISRNSITEGQTLTINGSIIPAHSDEKVTIEYSLNRETWIPIAVVKTDLRGKYQYYCKPGSQGTIHLRSSWIGDRDHEGAFSSSVILTIKPTGRFSPLDASLIVATVLVISAVTLFLIRHAKTSRVAGKPHWSSGRSTFTTSTRANTSMIAKESKSSEMLGSKEKLLKC